VVWVNRGFGIHAGDVEYIHLNKSSTIVKTISYTPLSAIRTSLSLLPGPKLVRSALHCPMS